MLTRISKKDSGAKKGCRTCHQIRIIQPSKTERTADDNNDSATFRCLVTIILHFPGPRKPGRAAFSRRSRAPRRTRLGGVDTYEFPDHRPTNATRIDAAAVLLQMSVGGDLSSGCCIDAASIAGSTTGDNNKAGRNSSNNN